MVQKIPKIILNENLLHIKQVTNDKIILDDNVEFENEKVGNDISLKYFQ